MYLSVVLSECHELNQTKVKRVKVHPEEGSLSIYNYI